MTNSEMESVTEEKLMPERLKDLQDTSSEMEPSLKKVFKHKLSHKQVKALRNRERRRLKRQQAAQERDIHLKEDEENENSPSFRLRQFQEEQREKYAEERRERERQLLHNLWLERERLALLEIAERKRKQEIIRQKQEEEEKRIREEWEEGQRKEKEEYEQRMAKERAKKEKQDALLKEARSGEKNTDDGSWHNPLAPSNYGPEAEVCPFFAKTGACRFGDQCSRAHPSPESSCTLLFKGMYAHFALMEGLQEEFDLDITLEYEEGETYQHFRDFYEDVLPEFKSIGRVVQFKVCSNYEPHLRGNVYVQYKREEDAQAAFVRFNARWYAGRQLQCEFCAVTRWKNAICGQFRTKKCPKGKNCNFLHVFQNPHREFSEADRDYEQSDSRSDRHSYSERNRYWSHSRGYRFKGNWDRRRARSRTPERYRRGRSRSPSRSVRRSRSKERMRRRSRSHSRSHLRSRHRSRSRSPRRSRYRSRSPRRSRARTRSRSRSRSPKRAKGSRSYRGYRKSRSKSKSPQRASPVSQKENFQERKSENGDEISKDWSSASESEDSAEDTKVKSVPQHNGQSPRSMVKRDPSPENSFKSESKPHIKHDTSPHHKARSPSIESSSSGKHKHKKDKRHKKKHSKKSKTPEVGEQTEVQPLQPGSSKVNTASDNQTNPDFFTETS